MSDREAGGEVSRSRVAEWEEPRHPGTASQEAKYPTSSHSATQNPLCDPHYLTFVATRPEKVAICSNFAVGRFSCRSSGVLHVTLQHARLQAVLRFPAGFSPPGGRSGRNCRQRVVSAGISAAAINSRTAGTSSSATTSWILGAALAACSER